MKTNEVRLIDANALLDAMPKSDVLLRHQVVDVICNSPSIDVAPVVRCKDCRYSEPMKKHGVRKFGENSLNCTQGRGDDGYGYTGISVIYPDDYCSDGARKDGEADD